MPEVSLLCAFIDLHFHLEWVTIMHSVCRITMKRMHPIVSYQEFKKFAVHQCGFLKLFENNQKGYSDELFLPAICGQQETECFYVTCNYNCFSSGAIWCMALNNIILSRTYLLYARGHNLWWGRAQDHDASVQCSDELGCRIVKAELEEV